VNLRVRPVTSLGTSGCEEFSERGEEFSFVAAKTELAVLPQAFMQKN